MLLLDLHLRQLKRIASLDLDFKKADGSPREWTVIIGRNGTAKTTILQAIALAAAGTFRANSLVEDIRESLPDVRVPNAAAEIEADFTFGPTGRQPEWHPMFDAVGHDPQHASHGPPRLRSWLKIKANAVAEGRATYVKDVHQAPEVDRDPDRDPLMHARTENMPFWFVAGYGVQRQFSTPTRALNRPGHRSIDRLRPLFEPSELLGPNFVWVLDDALSRTYERILEAVLLRTEGLVPGIVDLKLRGLLRSRATPDLNAFHRFVQRAGDRDIVLPATWLSHGYQSVLAWVSDLVGQILLEAGAALDSREMEGLVLIDEVDLYLHPSWQVGLVQALRETFPRMQFVVTTHSPILLTAFRREEVVVLDFDERGNVERTDTPKDPRLMTATELYEWFFGIDRLYPSELGDKFDAYNRIAANPLRSDEEDRLAGTLRWELEREGITPGVQLSSRRRVTGT